MQDDGTVTIGGVDAAMMEQARAKVDALTRELAVGDIFTGKFTRITNFGAFVELVPGREGLVRSGDFGDMESDEIKVGNEITVVIQEIDSQGRLNLSRRALCGGDGPEPTLPQTDSRPGFGGGRGRPGGGFGGRGGGGGRPSGPRPGGGDRRFSGGGGSR